jgi:hypothetical protein
VDAADQIVGDLAERGLLVHAGLYEHRYPHCWRCGHAADLPHLRRLVPVRRGAPRPLLDANATVEWTPAYMGKRMDDWLRNMGDWNISRRRYYGLPLPFYPCACGQLNVVGSKAELLERATGPVDDLEELGALGRRDQDPLRGVRRRGRADRRGRRRVARRRHRAVLDARLGEPRVRPRGLRDGAARGLTPADLPDHATGSSGSRGLGVGDARADPALVLLAALHVRRAHGPSAVPEVLGYEKMLDETGREMHSSWGTRSTPPTPSRAWART